MTKKVPTRKRARAQGASSHEHNTGRCLHILRDCPPI